MSVTEAILSAPSFCYGAPFSRKYYRSKWLLKLQPLHLHSKEQKKRKKSFLVPFFKNFQEIPTFLLTSHWLKLSQMTSLAAREAGKYNLLVGYWENH